MSRNITKLVTNGHFKEALHLYTQQHLSSIIPNKFTFPCLLKACTKLNSPLQGNIYHTQIIKYGFNLDTYTATSLVSMYMRFGEFKYAHQVFDEMPEPNLASVSATISGFCSNGCFNEGLVVFKVVGLRKFRPNSVMIASVLSACDVVEHGSQVHCWGIKIGVEREIYVGTGTVSMYMSCGDPVSATKVFGMMECKNVVSYNAFFSGLVQNGVYRVVLNEFRNMLRCFDDAPNMVTLVSVLGACSIVANLQYGKQIHGVALKIGVHCHTIVGTALIDMYLKCGCSHLAYQIFREMNGNRNVITWNSIISGMLLNGEYDTALELFTNLESEGLEPDSATWNTLISGFSRGGKSDQAFQFFTEMIARGITPSLKSLTSLLSACSIMCSLQHGKEIHAYAIRVNMDNDVFFSTALIDMYMKCGQSSWAHTVFDHFEIKPFDPPIWNAMISGYGRNGEYESALEIFDLMLKQNVRPNHTTFVNILSVCSHTGKVDKGLELFEMMNTVYGLIPNTQHFSCIVDLLGRAGHLNKAHEVIGQMSETSPSVFASLLGAAGQHTDFKLGEAMATKLSDLDPENSASLVILSNIYAAMGRWKDAERIRYLVDVKGVEKDPGYSVQMT